VDSNGDPDCPLRNTKDAYYLEFSADCSEDEHNMYGGIVNIGTEFPCNDDEPLKCGFFRTVKDISGRWWLVDPSNQPFFSAGLNSVYPQESPVFDEIFPNGLQDWTNSVRDLVETASINTLGCWSHFKDLEDNGLKMPYTVQLNMAQYYKGQSDSKYDNYNTYGAIPVFNKDFEAVLSEYAKNFIEEGNHVDDVYLLGYFSDNELPLYPSGSLGTMIERFLNLPPETDGFTWVRDWLLTERHPDSGLPDDETDVETLYSLVDSDDENEFTQEVSTHYYRATLNAIRSADPHHMHLGSRLHGSAKSNEFIMRGAKAAGIDVLSVNFYCKHDPLDSAYTSQDGISYDTYIQMWEAEGPGPSMITEYYTKALDANDNGDLYMNGRGAGYTVKNQEERAHWYEYFTSRIMQVNGIVGVHWFSYNDVLYEDPDTKKTEYSNRGLVNNSYVPYAFLQDSMSKFYKHVSQLVNLPLPVMK
jgi:hypothetical protein